MAALLAKQAVNALTREKPHSSITDWIEILTSSRYEVEAYDGIPEVVDSINIQGSEGTGEASRAIRKKLKHGDVHHQLRALVILKAIVENCGTYFQTHFADDRLLEAVKHLAGDSTTDPTVKKKLLITLASWKRQFEGDPQMRHVSMLYDQYKSVHRKSGDYGHRPSLSEDYLAKERERELQREREREEKEAAKREKEEAKRRAKKEKEEARNKQLRDAQRPKRKVFNFEEEKPKVLNSIVVASQASSNLVNALMLVNREKEPVEANQRVQECLTAAKTVRKQVVRYIQLVEDEELIGTLLETNERIIQALEMYDKYLIPDVNAVESQLSRTTLSESNVSLSELNKLQEKQRAAVAKAQAQAQAHHRGRAAAGSIPVHPDLQDLDFGGDAPGLPAPLRPRSADSEDEYRRGSLSDFSNYDSSDEEMHNRTRQRGVSTSPIGSKGKQVYRSFDNDGLEGEDTTGRQALLDDSDPFADPEVPTPGISAKRDDSWL